MPHDDLETIAEFQVGIAELRDYLGFAVQEVARSGTPVAIRRYARPTSSWSRWRNGVGFSNWNERCVHHNSG